MPHNLIKLTKTQVVARIRRDGSWAGYLVGNKVAPHSIENGWALGYFATFDSKEELEKMANSVLYYMDPELGNRVAYWEIDWAEVRGLK